MKRRGEEAYVGSAWHLCDGRSARTEDVFTHVWPLNGTISASFPETIQANEENGGKTLASVGPLPQREWVTAPLLVFVMHACVSGCSRISHSIGHVWIMWFFFSDWGCTLTNITHSQLLAPAHGLQLLLDLLKPSLQAVPLPYILQDLLSWLQVPIGTRTRFLAAVLMCNRRDWFSQKSDQLIAAEKPHHSSSQFMMCFFDFKDIKGTPRANKHMDDMPHAMILPKEPPASS